VKIGGAAIEVEATGIGLVSKVEVELAAAALGLDGLTENTEVDLAPVERAGISGGLIEKVNIAPGARGAG